MYNSFRLPKKMIVNNYYTHTLNFTKHIINEYCKHDNCHVTHKHSNAVYTENLCLSRVTIEKVMCQLELNSAAEDF